MYWIFVYIDFFQMEECVKAANCYFDNGNKNFDSSEKVIEYT